MTWLKEIEIAYKAWRDAAIASSVITSGPDLAENLRTCMNAESRFHILLHAHMQELLSLARHGWEQTVIELQKTEDGA